MEAEADGTILPFSFYCRNARLCLKKAIAARKFQLPAQELSHLRKFLKLVSVVLPCHPLFLDPKHQKACEELQRHLDGTRQRVKELEQASASSADEPPRALDCPRAQPRTPPACPLRQSSRPRSPVKTAGLHRPESSITPRIHGRVRPKRRLDSPAASGSCASTGCKKKLVGSWDFLSNLHQRYPYAFSRKHRPTSTTRKSTPLTTKPCWESPDGRACAGESLKSAAFCRLSGEVPPFRSRFMREMPRVGALSLLTSESRGISVEAGAMGTTCCEREREHGASSCAAFKKKAPSPPHVSPPTKQCDLGSRDRVRTLVQGTTRLDLPPSPAPSGRHLEKRPRSKSPQPDSWPNSLRHHKDRAEETCFPMPVATPKVLHPKSSPPSLSERIVDPVSSKANGEARWEETPPKSRTFRFSKKTRVEPSSGWLACTGFRSPLRDNKAKTREGEYSHDDDSSGEAHGLCGSISSTDCRQQPRPTRLVAASRSCMKGDDNGMSVQAEQLQCGQQNIGVREDCERLRAELRSLRAEVQDPDAKNEPQPPTDTEDAPPVDGAHSGACARGAGIVRESAADTGVCKEDSVLEEDAASCTQVDNEAGPALQSTSALKLAAQRERLMDLLHRTKPIEKGMTKEQRPRKGCKLVNPGGKGRRTQKAANACVNGKDSCSPSTSPSSSAYESSAPDQSASLSSVSLCHYAQSLNKPKGHPTCVNQHPEPRFTRPANSSPLRTTPGDGSQLEDNKVPVTETTPHPELSSPCTSSSSSPILIPTSLHGGADCYHDGCESAKSCKAGGLSDSSTACSSRAHDTPVREQRTDSVLSRCGLVAASQGRRAGSPVKGGKKIVLPKRERGAAGRYSCRTKTTLESCVLESCAQQEQGCCKSETNSKPHKLPPPSCFFIDMSDKVRNSSEDNSWCRVQEELKKTFIKKTNDIPSALEAHNENSEFLGNRLVSFVSQKLQSVQNELYEKKLSSLNRLVGELRGCVEGFRIRIDVEGEGWRGRVVGLEKELECLKDETEEELVDIKSRLLRDLKAKMDQIVAEKVESDDCCRETFMEEIRCFKTEMGCFVRDASKKVFMSEVQKLLTDHHAEIGETRTDIKKELKCFLEDKLEKAIYEALENPNGYFRKHLHHIRRVAAEAKLESEGLKKLEDALRAESKHIRKVVTRLEKDDIKRKLELEEFRRIVDEIDCRPKSGGSKRDASREKLIMERVESLSQMYLGGLEEVRSDLYSVKRTCRDRVNAIEAQWSDFQKQQELLDKGETSTPCSGQLRKYMLELDRFRDDLDEMKASVKGRSSSMMCDMDSNACLQRLVETERGYVRGLLERESSLIRGQVIDICEANKNEVAGILKAEVQKRVLGMKDKTDCMASTLRTDADSLQRNLLELQEGSEAVATALKRTERDRDKASAAAVEACQAASRASEVLEQVMGSFSNEMASARRKTVELQEGLISEARRASADVQQQRELAVSAVEEARMSSEKVGHILQEVVGTFSTEMGQAKRKSLMLQENLEKEILRAKGVAKEMESTSAKAGKTISDFTCEMECTRRKSLQLQEELEKDIASILESEKRKLFVTSEEPTCSRAPKLDQELEAVKDELRQLAYRVDGLADGHVQRACGDLPPHVGAPDPATREESLRLCVLEKKTVDACTGQAGGGDGVSLRLEHIEKRGGTCETSGRHEVLSIQHKGGGISVSVPFRLDGDRGDGSHAELLQGDSHMMGGYHRLESADTCAAGSSLDSRISNLESRLENVASATFSNLRLLDGKVEHVSVGVQAALEGAACAENKCAALGVELVKVFRMLARRPGSAASPGSDSYDHPRYIDGHVQDQSTGAHVPVRQGNMRKGCPVHDPEVNDASWPSTHQGSDCQLMQPTKDTGPPNPRGDSQRTKIKLDGGRIQVNVTSHHRQNKRPAPGSDMIVVQ